MLFTFLLVVHALIAAILVAVILMQRSEGGGLGMGGSPTGLMSARGAADFLTRATTILAALFVTLSIALAVLAAAQRAGTRTIDTSLARPAGALDQGLPAAPAPTTTAPPASTVPLADAPASPTPAGEQPAAVPIAKKPDGALAAAPAKKAGPTSPEPARKADASAAKPAANAASAPNVVAPPAPVLPSATGNSSK